MSNFFQKTSVKQCISALLALCLVFFVSLGTISAQTTTYGFGTIPTNGWKTAGGNQSLNGVTWAYSSNTYIGGSGRIQVGSSKNPQTTPWTISTPISSFGADITILSVSISAYTTNTTASYDISVGGVSVKNGSLATNRTTYTASNLAATSGNITITLTGSSNSAAMYLYDVTVTYTTVQVTPKTVRFSAGTGNSCPYESLAETIGGEGVTLPAATPCTAATTAGFSFAGWSTATVSETTTQPSALYAAGTIYVPTTDNEMLYAVYKKSDTTSNGTSSYVKVTSAPADWSGDYLIVYETGTQKYAFNGGLDILDDENDYIDVSDFSSENSIDCNEYTQAANFAIAKYNSNYSIKSASGYYIGNTSYSNALKTDTEKPFENKIALSEYNVLISSSLATTNTTLKFNAALNQMRFRYYKSGQQSISIYKLSGSLPTITTTYTSSLECTAASYKITYMVDDAEYETQNYAEGEAVVLPVEPTKDGYTFQGWVPTLPATMTAADIVTEAQWQINTYEITASVQPLGAGTLTFTSQEFEYGQNVSITATANEGYVFENWMEDSEEISTNSTLAFAANKNRNLVANFMAVIPNTYTITYSAGADATGSIENGTKTENVDFTLSDQTFTKTGYTQTGWTTVENGTKEYDLGGTYAANADLDLYPSWSINQYTISGHVLPNKAGTIKNTGTYDYNTPVSLEAEPADGYVFVKWTDDVYDNPRLITVTDDATYTAKFEFQTYAVTVNPTTGGTVSANPTEDVTPLTRVSVYATPDPGYVFSSWNIVATATSEPLEVVEGAFTMPKSDVTVSATFVAQEYDVTLHTNAGTINSGNVTTYTYGVGATLPTDVTRENYDFEGWFDNSELTGTAITEISTAETGAKEFWAKWSAVEYTITYRVDGEYYTTQTYKVGDSIVWPEPPTKEGYTFFMWVPTLPKTMPAQNLSAICAWMVNQYTVTASVQPEGAGTLTYTSHIFEYGQNTSLTATANEGYTFKSWTEDAVEISTDATLIFTVEKNRDLVANFVEVIPNSYTITYNAGADATGSIENGTKTEDVDFTLSDQTFTKTGYTQTGWTTVENGTKEYDLGGTYSANADLDLYPSWSINQYTISGHVLPNKAGTIKNTGTYDYNTPVSLEAEPADGYVFVKWTDDVYDNPRQITVTDDATYTAKFEFQTYTVTVNPATGGTVSANPTEDVTPLTRVSVSATPDPGYVFSSWNIVATATSEPLEVVEGAFTMPKSDVTVSATFEAGEYNVTLNTSEGTINSGNVTTYAYGVGATLPTDVTREGYEFGGWYDNSNFDGVAIAEIAATETGDKEYWAKWTANEYTVILYTNEGIINSGDVTNYTYGVGATLPTDVTREGYEFGGWYDNSNFDGVAVTEISTTETGNKEFWAKWTANEYTVTLNTNEGTINSGDVTNYTYGVGATLPTDVTKEGHEFGGWYDNGNFDGVAVTEITTTETGDKEFWAKWTANEYTVTLNINEGTINTGNVTTYTYGVGATLPTDVTKEGHEFGGWYDNSNFDGTAVAEITATETGSKEYWAKWTVNQYNVTLNANGGTINSGDVTNYTYGVGATLPTDVTKAGSDFEGWYDNSTFSGSAVTAIETTATGDKEYWAKWSGVQYTLTINYLFDDETVAAPKHEEQLYYEAPYSVESPDVTGCSTTQLTVSGTMPANDVIVNVYYTPNEYNVTLNSNEGTINSGAVAAYTYGVGATLPTDVTREGHEFGGWYDNSNFDGVAVAEIAATETGNKEYWAKWIANEYTVTLNTNEGTINSGAVTAYTYGVGATLPIDVTREGHEFGGWYDNNNFDGVAVTEIAATETGNKEFWAKWTANEYTVTLNTNEGTINTGGVANYTYGVGATLPTDVTREGHEFGGWYDNSNFDGKAVVEITTTETGNKEFWAKWTANEYTVTLNTNEGTINSGNVTNYTYGVGATLPTDVTRDGYAFVGWYDNNNLDGTTVTEISTTELGNKEFWAKWNINKYTLTINYKYANNTEAAKTYTDEVDYLADYEVASPDIPTYMPNKAIVSGEMPIGGVEIDVVYQQIVMDEVPNQVVCATQNISTVKFSSPIKEGTMSYAWTNDNLEFGLASDGVDNIESFETYNQYETPLVATITVTPSCTRDNDIYVGQPTQFTITVNPVHRTEFTMTQCDEYEWEGDVYREVGTHDYEKTLKNQYQCDSIVTMHLTIYQTPDTIEAEVVDNTMCEGTPNGSISITNFGKDYEFSLDGVNYQSDAEFSELAENDYDVYVRFVGSTCAYKQTIHVGKVITLPDVVMSTEKDVYCVGDQLNVNTTGTSTGAEFSFAWTGPQGYASTEENPVVEITTGLQSDWYQLEVTNNNTNCVNKDSVKILVNAPSNPDYLFTITCGVDAYANIGITESSAAVTLPQPEIVHYLTSLEKDYIESHVQVTNNVASSYDIPGDYEVQWIATDDCGNADTCIQMVHITQVECPVAQDWDGYTYPSVKFGSACWTVVNLRSEHYSNGAEIPNVMKYQSSQYPEVDASIYGYLYDWNSVVAEGTELNIPNGNGHIQGVCPEGWYLPTAEQYRSLINQNNGLTLDENRATQYWLDGGGTNTTGLTLVPAGRFNSEKDRYENLLGNCYYWNAYESTSTSSQTFEADCHCWKYSIYQSDKSNGFSVRCIKE